MDELDSVELTVSVVDFEEEIGDMVETAVYAQWIPRQGVDISFANWRLNKRAQGEVDIVGIDAGLQKPQWAVEIKWSDRYAEHPGELESLLWYMPKNGLTDAIVTTKTLTMNKEMDNVALHFLPVACYAYTVAANTIKTLVSYMDYNVWKNKHVFSCLIFP